MSRLKGMSVALACLAQPASAAPLLEATVLYKETAHECRAVDLKQWSHPIKRVLARAQVEIIKVELCNNGVYPIFTVAFKYDPQGPNDAYYNRLFAEMAAANGYHSYSLVDPGWAIVINVKVAGKKSLSVDYEDFAPPAKQ